MADACSTYTLKCLVAKVIAYFQIAIVLIIALAVVVFVWNVYKYFFTEQDKTEAGKYVMYSILGFFIILSFWGFVAIISNTLDIPNAQPGWPFNGGGGGGSNFNLPPQGSTPGTQLQLDAPPAGSIRS